HNDPPAHQGLAPGGRVSPPMVDDQVDWAKAGRPVRIKPVPAAYAEQLTEYPSKPLVRTGVSDTHGRVRELDLNLYLRHALWVEAKCAVDDSGMLYLTEVVQRQLKGRLHAVLQRAHVSVTGNRKHGKGSASALRLNPDRAMLLADLIIRDLGLKSRRSRALAVARRVEGPAVVRALQPAMFYTSAT